MQQVEVNDIKIKKDDMFHSLWLSKISKDGEFEVIDTDYRILKNGLWYKFKKRPLYVNGFWKASKIDTKYPLSLHLRLSNKKGSKDVIENIFDSYFTLKNPGFRMGATIGDFKLSGELNAVAIGNNTDILRMYTRNGEITIPRIYIEGSQDNVKEDKWFKYLDGESFTVPYIQTQDNVLFTYNGGSNIVPVVVSNGNQNVTLDDTSKSSVEDYDILDLSPVDWLTIQKINGNLTITCSANSLQSDREHSISLIHKDYKWLKRTIQIQQVANPTVGLQNFDNFIINTTPSSYSSGSCEIDTQIIIEGSGLSGYVNGKYVNSIDNNSVGWSHNSTIGLKPSTKFEDVILYGLDSTSGGKAEQVVFNLVNLDTPESHALLSDITTIRIYVNWYNNNMSPEGSRWNMDLGITTYKNGFPAKSVPPAGSAGQIVLSDSKQSVKNFSLSNTWIQGKSVSSSDLANYYEIATITYNKNTKEGNIELHTIDKNG